MTKTFTAGLAALLAGLAAVPAAALADGRTPFGSAVLILVDDDDDDDDDGREARRSVFRGYEFGRQYRTHRDDDDGRPAGRDFRRYLGFEGEDDDDRRRGVRRERWGDDD